MTPLSKRDFTILLGNILDHFDTSLYIFLAPILSPLFFPANDPIVSLITAYGVLATTIITRPIGTYIFGMIAGNKGAANALSISLLGVGGITILIGCIPDYSTLGIISTILFIFCRIIREIFSAGEITIARLYVLDNKSEQEALKSSYLFQASTMLGIICASVAATIIYYIEVKNSWRVCYFIGGSAAMAGYLIRKHALKANQHQSKGLFKYRNFAGMRILWINKLKILKIAIVCSFSYVTYLVPFIIMTHLVPLVTNIEIKTMMATNNILLLLDLLLIPLIGKIIQNYNYIKVMKLASAMLAFSILPLFCFIENSSLYYINFVRFWIIFWGVVYMCPLNLWCNNQINSEEKYIVIGMGSTLGSGIIGKLCPTICLIIFYYNNSLNLVSLYLTIIFFAAWITIINSSADKIVANKNFL
jgi:MFS family permease